MTEIRRLLSRARRALPVLGVTILAIGGLAAFVAAIVLMASSAPDGPGDGASNGNAQPPDPPVFPAADYRQSRFPSKAGEPLIGTNYTHYAFPRCSYDGTGILRSYSMPGIAQKVHRQLLAMRRAGVATIRTIIWHMTDATGQSWGPVSSAGGKLQRLYRANLIRYMTEIRKFGFVRLTLSLGPQQANNPLREDYDPSKFEENWHFIAALRSLLKRYGPSDTRIDLLNEGAPSEFPTQWSPVPSQTGRYLRRLYRRYVKRFGNRDVSISAIAWDRAGRVRNLVQILRSTGQPMPGWYDVHIGYQQDQASYALGNTDEVLDMNRLGQPLVVGETAYNNPGIADAIGAFLQTDERRIEEISPWYVRRQKGCQIAPPYSRGAYGAKLRER